MHTGDTESLEGGGGGAGAVGRPHPQGDQEEPDKGRESAGQQKNACSQEAGGGAGGAG